MYCATIVWAYDDMELARKLWPRVKTAVEDQVARDNLNMDLGRQRQVIAAIVNDLMDKRRPPKRQHWCSPKSISKLPHLFRRPNPSPVSAAARGSGRMAVGTRG
jgi:hypothetical protein